MDSQDSSDHPNRSENRYHSSSGDANLPEKRKREPEPNPETSPDPPVPPPPQHPLWKTSLCSYFHKTGGLCSHGETCRFAHGEDELRLRPDNTWDPTSERAKKMAKIEENEQEEAQERGVMMTEALEAEEEECSSSLSKCIVNLPMKWSSDNLRNFLNEQGIIYKSAKKKKGMTVGFVTFGSSEGVKNGQKELAGRSVGNNKTLKVVDVIPRSFEKNNRAALPLISNEKIEKSSADSDQTNLTESTNTREVDEDGTSFLDGSVLKARSARDAVTPLAHLPYSDQLEHKKNSLMQTLKRLTRNARKACPHGVSLPEWISKSREIAGLPCKLEGIIESPLINGYRNKCEFSVGCSLQGKHTVGFLLGNFREGVTAIQEPVDCPNVSKIACKYASIFQEYLQHSQLPVWNRLNNTGFWRQLTVREGRTPCRIAESVNPEDTISELMLIVQVCTVGSDDGLVNDELQRLAQTFYVGSTSESPHLPLTTLVIQDHTGISNAAPPDTPLRFIFVHREGSSGLVMAENGLEPRIHDHINNLRFSISPSAFFQVNTLAAEKLYSLAGDWAGLGPDTLLFDICCGTGTIGLTLAHRVGMVVGIEMNASAVSDAQRNAEINGVKNCLFVCGKAEDVIGSLMKEYLSLPQKQAEDNDATQHKESEVNIAEGNNKSSEGSPGPGDKAGIHQENGCSTNENSKDVSQLEKHNSSENRVTPVFKNIVAIVDPPRVGLHPTVIKVLRTNSGLRRLVYISCNPESLVANAIELCTPSVAKTEGNNKNNRAWRNMTPASLARHRSKSMPNSEPFKPIKAMAIDLFPHTPHCELVMLLER